MTLVEEAEMFGLKVLGVAVLRFARYFSVDREPEARRLVEGLGAADAELTAWFLVFVSLSLTSSFE